ncbi:MAG: 4Fe-4S binding protein [Candidatus Zixiibacteriota bacterium]
MLVTYVKACLNCGACVALCPVEALFLLKSGIQCDLDACIDCGECATFCPVDALELRDAG